MKIGLVFLGVANIGFLVFLGHAKAGFPYLAVPFFIFALILIWWPEQKSEKRRKKPRAGNHNPESIVWPFGCSKDKSGHNNSDSDFSGGGSD
ncbi:hypothetical protein FE845_14395 [Marinobacter sp. 1-4A]|uniref:hypothetical protein n=1 Tax=unclassified Marinobacter TaxID=83889 RepID=UPI0019088F27|nr:hypothetical protein [Marinobacter sp. 1-4A]MBK1852537.1 hypothetical protein [Marinobacter sp. 1-4A]